MPNPYPPILEIIKTKPFSVMLDVGIRHGGEWDYFSEQLPDVRLVAMEPHKKERDKFLATHPGAEVYPSALWSEASKRTLVTSTGLCPSMQLAGKGQEVECVTLDWFCDRFIPDADLFLWIDIEGSELEAFKGGRRMLESGRIPFIYTELRTADKVRSAEWCVDVDVIEFLARYGYSVELTQHEELKEHYDALFVRGA
jgi:FkbM family methyltransferase